MVNSKWLDNFLTDSETDANYIKLNSNDSSIKLLVDEYKCC